MSLWKHESGNLLHKIIGDDGPLVAILAGRPATGKTTLAVQAAEAYVKHGPDRSVVFLSNELTQDLLLKRFSPKFAQSESFNRVIIDDEATYQRGKITRCIPASHSSTLVIVDYVGLFSQDERVSLTEEISEIQGTGQRHHFLLLCQISLESEWLDFKLPFVRDFDLVSSHAEQIIVLEKKLVCFDRRNGTWKKSLQR